MLEKIILVGIGGFFGAVLRYLTGLLCARFWEGYFPLATLLVNMAGCLVMGFVVGMAQRPGMLSPQWVVMLTAGFCGGFTTYSAFANESFSLATDGHSLLALGYLLATVVGGVVMIWIGRWIAQG